MPYAYYEELPEGIEAADVVDRSEYDAVITERDEIATQRDGAIERAESAEADARKAKEKYANAFLTTPNRVKEEQKANVKKDSGVQSFAQLFAKKEGN